MTQEEKDLLLKDLSARLPYQPLCKKVDTEDDFCECDGLLGYSLRDLVNNKVIIKPYLRPMSSMTDEEKEEFKNKFKGFFQYFNGSIISDSRIYDRNEAVFVGEESCGELIDWLNKKMFDFRRLIPKDLALSTDEYNPYVKD